MCDATCIVFGVKSSCKKNATIKDITPQTRSHQTKGKLCLYLLSVGLSSQLSMSEVLRQRAILKEV